MNFGEILTMECNNELGKRIYEKLKPYLLKCAKKREKGCQIKFTDFDEFVIKDLFKLLEEDGIIIEENEYLIWDKSAIKANFFKNPDPCTMCHLQGPERWTCCGCPEKIHWDKTSSKEEKNLYLILSTIFISLENDEIKIVLV